LIPIAVTTWPDEATRTSNSACVWTAEAMVEGRTYTARSRHGPANQLARQLVAAGLTRTSNSACVWTAEAMVEGRTYTAVRGAVHPA
jgi:hypothetical protein